MLRPLSGARTSYLAYARRQKWNTKCANSRDLYNQSLAIPRCRSEHSLATRPVIDGGSSILCTLTELPPLVPGPRSHETSHFRRIIIEYERDRFEANVTAPVW